MNTSKKARVRCHVAIIVGCLCVYIEAFSPSSSSLCRGYFQDTSSVRLLIPKGVSRHSSALRLLPEGPDDTNENVGSIGQASRIITPDDIDCLFGEADDECGIPTEDDEFLTEQEQVAVDKDEFKDKYKKAGELVNYDASIHMDEDFEEDEDGLLGTDGDGEEAEEEKEREKLESTGDEPLFNDMVQKPGKQVVLQDEVVETMAAALSSRTAPLSDGMAELVALESLATKSQLLSASDAGVDKQASVHPDEPSEGSFLDYLDLDRKVKTGRESQRLASLLSIDEELLVQTGVDGSKLMRSIKYDPQKLYKGDRMKYGAYRRWQPGYEEEGLKGKTGSKVRKSGGSVAPGAGKKRKEGGKNGGSPDSFYNAIKNLGSGPKGAGEATGVGEVDAPKGKKPVVAPKLPMKRSQRQVITPDDIDSLFPDPEETSAQNPDGTDALGASEAALADGEDDFMENADKYGTRKSQDDAGLRNGAGIGSLFEGQSAQGYFNPMMDDDEEVPEWIKQADKEAKEAAMARRYPKKAITDDWRFWLACIGGVGFVSAAFNMYQQTGGFGGSTAVRPELII